MEDESGIANAIITPDLYERERLVVTRAKFSWSKALFRIRMA
jgi:error-prone DNA polymerase